MKGKYFTLTWLLFMTVLIFALVGNAEARHTDHTQNGPQDQIDHSELDLVGIDDNQILVPAIMTSSGLMHTCAVTATGKVLCWGNNEYGQLGNGTTTNRSTPANVVGLSSGVVSVGAGMSHTCIVTASGGVKCWGDNYFGQLGDGSIYLYRSDPVDVVGLSSGVASVSAGGMYTCAVMSAGGVKCWGRNDYGQLGDGTNTNSPTPVDVDGLSNRVVVVSAGENHACAVTTAGGVKCWGNNQYGQIGDDTTTFQNKPVDVKGLSSGAVSVSAGYDHTCAVTDAGGVKFWGHNNSGQLGDETTDNQKKPVDVKGLSSEAVSVSAGGAHTCAVTAVGSVMCWGNNSYGRLGDGTTTYHVTPVDVDGLTSGAVSVSAGGAHTCVLTAKGQFKCWGNNYFGQLGDGITIDRHSPVDVVGLSSGLVSVSAGNSHTCAITAAGGVKCWGKNSHGQLGDGTTIDQSTPVDVILSDRVVSISAGQWHTCAVTTEGGVKCWGNNQYGQLGDGTTIDQSTPVDVILSDGVVSISAGHWHTCAVTTSGGVKCWGNNNHGQLGDGTTIDQSTPVDVDGLTGWGISVSAGSSHTCATTTAGEVKCWGYNAFGQLGDGTTTDRHSPVDVSNLSSELISLSAGVWYTCGVTTAGELKCWGHNAYGQLGDGTTTNRLNPVDVIGLSSGVDSVSAGFGHTCAVTLAGGVKCWGRNERGQLGDDTTDDRSTPNDVVGLSNGTASVSTGDQHTCALTTAGGVKCWGNNEDGQLGWKQLWVPVDVIGFEEWECFLFLPIISK
jgi:alpha-tubulin suppressor-like RCC1 family protein